MTVELLQLLSLVSFIVAGVCFAVAAALFVLLDVPKLIRDLSGASARKVIEEIRLQNEQSGDKIHKPSIVNMERGKVTNPLSPSGKLRRRTGRLASHPGTQKLATEDLAPVSNETTLLEQPANETTVLCPPADETTVLEQDSGTTTVLNSGATTVLTGANNYGFWPSVSVLVELEFMSSTEWIE